MKKVIRGKLYDTSTAQYIGEYNNMNDRGNFAHYCEELYKKRTGEFFLYGEGGPMSKYAVQESYNNISGSHKIMPLCIEEAKEWAEEHLDADIYQQHFDVVADDENVVMVSAYIKKSTKEAIDTIRANDGKTIGQIIDEAILNSKK